MRIRAVRLLPILVLMWSCGTPAGPPPQPPTGSFAVVHAQLKLGDSVVPVQGAIVATDFFSQTGFRPLVGRFFIESDQRLSGSVIVIGHDLWTDRFGASPDAIGRTVELDGRPATIVGIAPSTFTFPAGTQFWTPK